MGRLYVYLPTWMVDFCGINLGIYYMHPISGMTWASTYITLVGDFNPSEKYASQIGSFSQGWW